VPPQVEETVVVNKP